MELNWAVFVSLLILVYLALRDDLLEVYLARKDFKCKRCGKCCQLKVALTDEEAKALKKKGYANHVEKGYIKRINGWCPFLGIENGRASCKIYSDRPEICRNWPSRKHFRIRAYDNRCSQFKRPWFLP